MSLHILPFIGLRSTDGAQEEKKAISGSVVRGNKDEPWTEIADYQLSDSFDNLIAQSSLTESVVITTAKRSESQNPSQMLKQFGHTNKLDLIGEKKSTVYMRQWKRPHYKNCNIFETAQKLYIKFPR